MEKKTRTLDLLFLLVCNMVGMGIFSMPHYVLRQTGSCLSSILLVVLSGIIATLFGLCYAELGSTYPYPGGDLNYLGKAYSQWVGTIYSLVSISFILPLSCAVMSTTIHGCFEDIIGRDSFIMMLLPLCSLFLSFGGRMVTWTIRMLVFLKFITLIFLLITSFLSFFITGKIIDPAISDIRNETSEMNLSSMIHGLCFTQFSFDGWNCGNYIANRIHNPGRTFPRAIIGSIWCVVLIYIMTNISFMCVVPYDVIFENERFISEYFRIIGIPITPRMLSTVVILIPTLGSLMCSFVVGSGIIESLIPMKSNRMMGMISLGVFSCVVFLFTRMSSVMEMISKISFGISFFYTLSCLGLVILKRRSPKIDRPFNLPIIVPSIASLAGGLVCCYIIKVSLMG